MTVMRNVTKTSKLFAAILCIVGAFIFAPTCAAYDDSNIPDAVKACLDTSLTATQWDKADCSFFSVHYFWNGSGYYCTYLIHSTDVKYVDFHVNSNGTNGNFATYSVYSDEYNHNSSTMLDFYMYSEEYSLGGLNDTSSVGYGDFPFEVVTSFPAEYFSCNVPSAVDVNAMSPPIDTTEQTYSDMMLQEYLHNNGFGVSKSTAWLVSPSGQPTQIPLSFTEPFNYNGDIWVKCTPFTPYLDKFTPIVRDDVSLVDYSGYKISILYDFEVTDVSLYAVTDSDFVQNLSAYPSINVSDTPHGDHSSLYDNEHGYYTIQDVSYWGDLCIVNNSQNERTQLYCIWEFNPLPASAIPHLVPLYVGLDVVTTDTNGNTVISRNSNDYNTFVTNYNQKAITGLSGFITGRTSFSGDWRGNAIDTTINYQNDFTFSDSNVSSLFAAVFAMGDGFVLTSAIGVISIALAAYVLFGKH